MTAVENRPATDTFESLDPATGAVVGTFPIHDEAAVRAAVDRARGAAQWWSGLGYGGRRQRLLAWKRLVTARLEELADLLRRENGKVRDDAVFQIVTGFGATGAALCRAGVDKLAFTGSAATGRKVMAACAETLTPVLMECGGKDAVIVDADADVEAAADAVLWGSCTNAGQTCAGVERVYVVDAVHDRFVAALVERARELATPDSFGPITMPRQLDVIRRHIDDAIARGGTAVVGGPESVQPPYVGPVVLTGVPEAAAAVQEETFGPVTIVNRVPDADEAVRRANGTAYGLGATVFARRRGMELARRLRAGMVAVNGVLSYAGVPSLPFGGVGESGFGRIHGAEGMREFVRPKAIARTRFPALVNLTTYRRKPSAVPMLLRTVKFIGRR